MRSSPPPKIIDVEEEPPLQDAGGFFFEELSWDFSDLPEIELHLEDDTAAHGEASSATIKELHQAAQSYGGTVATFTARLTSRHFDEFWYSCKYSSRHFIPDPISFEPLLTCALGG